MDPGKLNIDHMVALTEVSNSRASPRAVIGRAEQPTGPPGERQGVTLKTRFTLAVPTR
ncbi:hypothetical protein GCM10010275_70860 [Streptomyces litmocidini]|nr:hypothetical protein GCM10010275_70860 [Streptomyces litmocidini]